MSTDPTFECSQCKNCRLSDEFGTRQREGRRGKKGDRLDICLSCTTANSTNRNRNRMESNSDRPVKLFATPTAFSASQFVEALAEHASASEIDVSSRVSLDHIPRSDKDVAGCISALVKMATGYRFILKNSEVTDDGSSKRFTYECCQARGASHDRDEQSAVGEENQGSVRHTEHFECHGRLYVTPHEGVAVVRITHRQSHQSCELTEPHSFEGRVEHMHQQLMDVTAFLESQGPHMTPEFLDEFLDNFAEFFKFVQDSKRDLTRRTPEDE